MTMAYTRSPRDEPASIGPLDGLIDLWLSTEHTLASEVSSDPIENGSPLTDHIVRRPNKLRLHGGVSDQLLEAGWGQSKGRRGSRDRQKSAPAWRGPKSR